MAEHRGRRKPGAARRRRQLARQRALQALYQWQLTGQSAGDIESQFLPSAPEQPPEAPPAIEPDRELEDAVAMSDVDIALFRELLHGVLERLEDWDAEIGPHLNRSIARLDPVERLILRMGTYELSERLDIPYRVVINEYVELCKQFGGQDSYKYVNGVLDKVAGANRFRRAEMDMRGKPGPGT